MKEELYKFLGTLACKDIQLRLLHFNFRKYWDILFYTKKIGVIEIQNFVYSSLFRFLSVP